MGFEVGEVFRVCPVVEHCFYFSVNIYSCKQRNRCRQTVLTKNWVPSSTLHCRNSIITLLSQLFSSRTPVAKALKVVIMSVSHASQNLSNFLQNPKCNHPNHPNYSSQLIFYPKSSQFANFSKSTSFFSSRHLFAQAIFHDETSHLYPNFPIFHILQILDIFTQSIAPW